MAKCGHPICPDTNCALKHPFNRGRRNTCKAVQRCVSERCSTLKALGPSGFTLYDVCIGHCNGSPTSATYPTKYQTPDAYLCANFNAVDLVDYFGINPCQINEADTKVGQLKAASASDNNQTQIALLFMGAFAAILLIIFYNR